MKGLEHLKKNIRSKITTVSFCIGIGTDQLTPEYFSHSVNEYLGEAIPKQLLVKHEKKQVKTNSISLQKSNYGRRVGLRHT